MSKEIEALEKIIAIKLPINHSKDDLFILISIAKQIATEAIDKREDSSGKETGSDQIFYVAVNEKDIPQNYDEEVFFYCPQIEKWLKPVNSQSVPPYKEEVGGKVERLLKYYFTKACWVESETERERNWIQFKKENNLFYKQEVDKDHP